MIKSPNKCKFIGRTLGKNAKKAVSTYTKSLTSGGGLKLGSMNIGKSNLNKK